MLSVKGIKLFVFVLFLAGGASLLLAGRLGGHAALAYSAGPPAGFTNAPGEFNCAECHLPPNPPDPGTGQLVINAPQTYVPGQTYEVTIRQSNADQTRQRWGFQLTALDASNARAGTLQSTDALTQVLSDQGPGGNRQYVEHTSAGTFNGQKNQATWTFNWTAPAVDVGPVTFYAAGNQANGDQNTSGDYIYHTFTTSTPGQAQSSYAVTASPAARMTTPGGATNYTITLNSLDGFNGQVNLSVAGLPSGATANFNPSTLTLTPAGPQSSTLNVTTAAGTPLGSYPLTINATSGSLTRSANVTLHVVSPTSADLSITKTASPDPVAIRTTLSYRIAVTNNGPAAASGVVLTDTLAASVNLVSVTPGQGSCSGASTINCALGSLKAGESATVVLNVQPQTTGTLSNTASVTADESDPISGNNSATVSTLVQPQGTSPSMTVPGLGVKTFTSGLDQPTSMAFIGANDLLVLEKATGRVVRVTQGSVKGAVLDLAVNSASERGLLGIALHPNFAANGYVYLYWTWRGTGTGAGNLLGADTSNVEEVPLLGNRVDRFVWNGSVLTFDRNLISLRAFQADAEQPPRGNHNGGVLRFGPDGKLYIVVGDEGRRGLLQNINTNAPDDQFGGPAPDNAHLTGVILRLNDDGSVPSDNPFFNASTTLAGEAASNVKKIFAYGVRNSFGMAFDPQSGKLWTQENGDDAFDEINLVEPGFNGGWTQIMGPSSRIAEYKAIETTRSGGLQQVRWPPSLLADTPQEALSRLYMLPGATYTEPQFSWKYAVAPSPIGFASSALGAAYAGDLFVGASRTTLLGGYLFRLKLSADRRAFAFNQPELQDRVADNADKFDLRESEALLAGRDFGITTDIQTGPDGNLYVVSLSNGAIYQIFSQPTLYVATLTGAQETPPNNSQMRGLATILLDKDETTARVSLVSTGFVFPNEQTGAHIHGPAAPGTSAAVLFELPLGNFFNDFQITLTPAQVRDLKNGLLYINLHSKSFPEGEIRGQFSLAPAPSVLQLFSSTASAEESGHGSVAVVRMGDLSSAATVDFATSDGTASERSDYTTARGTFRFAPGERFKNIILLPNDDTFDEPDETVNISISNATGPAAIGDSASMVFTILDNDPGFITGNPLDDDLFFIRQHYHDFLNRDPDEAGLSFWMNEIRSCGTNVGCREVKRINVSAAFFLSIEFQETGYFVYRLYQTTFNRQPRFAEFIAGAQEIGRDVIVNRGPWQQQLAANRQAFLDAWVNTPEFKLAYDGLSNQQYVATLTAHAGTPFTAEQLNGWVADLNAGRKTRLEVLREITDDEGLRLKEKNRAFVLMEYFGYLRRNPDDAPDGNLSGYNFWLGKLESHGGNYITAEMVKAFITSGEYRHRFGP